MNFENEIKIEPVGHVRTQAVGNEVRNKKLISEIEFNPELQNALDGISGYSHLYVLFWLNEVPEEKRKLLKVHPRGRSDLPLIGVFSVRTNLRPNPIGLTLVEFVKVEKNVLTVRGLDAFNGSPVIDIKPCDYWDIPKEPKVPDWWQKLENEKTNAN